MTNIKLLKIAEKYADVFLVDIKILDKNLSSEILNGDVDSYYDNLKFLFSKNKDLIFRIPLINEFTLTDKNIDLVLNLLNEYNPKKVEIFKIHNLAEKKYKVLNKKPFGFSEVNDKKVNEFYDKIKKIVRDVEIISL